MLGDGDTGGGHSPGLKASFTHASFPSGQSGLAARSADTHFPLLLPAPPRLLTALRLISLRHTRSILENRLQLFGVEFLYRSSLENIKVAEPKGCLSRLPWVCEATQGNSSLLLFVSVSEKTVIML